MSRFRTLTVAVPVTPGAVSVMVVRLPGSVLVSVILVLVSSTAVSNKKAQLGRESWNKGNRKETLRRRVSYRCGTASRGGCFGKSFSDLLESQHPLLNGHSEVLESRRGSLISPLSSHRRWW